MNGDHRCKRDEKRRSQWRHTSLSHAAFQELSSWSTSSSFPIANSPHPTQLLNRWDQPFMIPHMAHFCIRATDNAHI